MSHCSVASVQSRVRLVSTNFHHVDIVKQYMRAVEEVNASKNFLSMLRPVVKSTPHSCTLKHRTTILISSACNIINDYSKLFIVATPNKTIKILPYLVTRAKSSLLVHISRSIDAFATAKQPYESSWSVQSPETIEKCSFTFSRA